MFRQDEWDEKILDDYKVKGMLKIYQVNLVDKMSKMGKKQPVLIHAEYEVPSRVPNVMGWVNSDVDCKKSSFLFDEKRYGELNWDPLGLVGKYMVFTLTPKLVGKNGGMPLFETEQFKPWDMRLDDLCKVCRGKDVSKYFYLASFNSVDNPEVSGDSSVYRLNTFITSEEYNNLVSNNHYYKLELRLL